MKRLLITAAALSMLIGPAVGFAQDHHDDGHHDGGGRPGGAGGGGGTPHSTPAAPQAQAAPQAPRGPQPGYRPQGQQGQTAAQIRPQAQQFPGGQGGYRPQPGQNGYRPQGGQPNSPFQGGQDRNYPDRGYQDRGVQAQGGQYRGAQGGYRQQGGQPGGQFQRSRSGGQAFSYGGRSYMRYRADAYRYPAQYSGWSRHAWRRGEWLPSAFISPYYFIDDFYDYDLWQPDYGFQWIRVGQDAILVNLASGQVVDVVPGVYYY